MKSTKKPSSKSTPARKGKAEGSKRKRQRIEAEADEFKRKAHEYATEAYKGALAHFEATGGKTGTPVFFKPLEVDARQFAQYQQDGRFFAGILDSPDCPQQFRDLFAAVFGNMCDAAAFTFRYPSMLPLTYAVVRDICDAQDYCGTAEGLHNALIFAVEMLVPRPVADASRATMKRG